MDFTQELFTSRRNYEDGNVKIGHEGRLWYDSITNTIRVGDGNPGGKIVSGIRGAPRFNVVPPEDYGQVLTYHPAGWTNVYLTDLLPDVAARSVEVNLSGTTQTVDLQSLGIVQLITYRVINTSGDVVEIAKTESTTEITINSLIDMSGLRLIVVGF